MKLHFSIKSEIDKFYSLGVYCSVKLWLPSAGI